MLFVFHKKYYYFKTRISPVIGQKQQSLSTATHPGRERRSEEERLVEGQVTALSGRRRPVRTAALASGGQNEERRDRSPPRNYSQPRPPQRRQGEENAQMTAVLSRSCWNHLALTTPITTRGRILWKRKLFLRVHAMITSKLKFYFKGEFLFCFSKQNIVFLPTACECLRTHHRQISNTRFF